MFWLRIPNLFPKIKNVETHKRADEWALGSCRLVSPSCWKSYALEKTRRYVYKRKRNPRRPLGTGDQRSPFFKKSDVLWRCEVSPGVRCREEAWKRPERTQCETALSRDTGLRSWAAHPLPLNAPKAGGSSQYPSPQIRRCSLQSRRGNLTPKGSPAPARPRPSRTVTGEPALPQGWVPLRPT